MPHSETRLQRPTLSVVHANLLLRHTLMPKAIVWVQRGQNKLNVYLFSISGGASLGKFHRLNKARTKSSFYMR